MRADTCLVQAWTLTSYAQHVEGTPYMSVAWMVRAVLPTQAVWCLARKANPLRFSESPPRPGTVCAQKPSEHLWYPRAADHPGPTTASNHHRRSKANHRDVGQAIVLTPKSQKHLPGPWKSSGRQNCKRQNTVQSRKPPSLWKMSWGEFFFSSSNMQKSSVLENSKINAENKRPGFYE